LVLAEFGLMVIVDMDGDFWRERHGDCCDIMSSNDGIKVAAEVAPGADPIPMLIVVFVVVVCCQSTPETIAPY
jgi:hypothetical protein